MIGMVSMVQVWHGVHPAGVCGLPTVEPEQPAFSKQSGLDHHRIVYGQQRSNCPHQKSGKGL